MPESDHRGLGHRGGCGRGERVWDYTPTSGASLGSLGWWGDEGVETMVKEEVGEQSE